MIISYIGEQGRRARQAQGQEDRLHLPRRRLRQGADPAARGSSPRTTASTVKLYPVAGAGHAEPVVALAQRAPRPAGLHDHVGLGRDEPDRRQGSGQDRLPDGQVRRRLVGGRRGRRAAGGGQAAKGYQGAQLQRGRARTSRRSRTSRSTSSTRARARSPKDKVGENLYNRGVYNSMLIAEAIRNAQKITGKKVVTGEDVRRGLETLNITGGALEGARPRGLRGADRSVTCADHNGHRRPSCSSGTARSGSRSPTGSSR